MPRVKPILDRIPQPLQLRPQPLRTVFTALLAVLLIHYILYVVCQEHNQIYFLALCPQKPGFSKKPGFFTLAETP
jgi:hypothetical protein